MLAPDSRALLLDALRPPPGYSLDHAVATTFTLELESALMVPLAFAGFRFEEQPDPVEVMQALREMSTRFDVFCQAGAISDRRWPSDLLALLEDVVHDVRRPRPGHIFHPKVWVLRFLDQSRSPSYRLLVLSRNLTADRSWDTILWLDGSPGEDSRAGNAPLSHFIDSLPDLAVTSLPAGRRAALTSLAGELRLVDWDLPQGAREARFHTIGLPGSRPFAVEEIFSGQRALVISPFVRAGALQRLVRPEAGQASVLVSRGEELAALPPETLEPLDAYELDPTASLSVDDDGTDDTDQAFLTRLHAKLFVVERGRCAHLFVGSANATDAGLAQNVEFLCELVGSVGTLGVDALVGDDARLRAMLTPYVASESQGEDDSSPDGRALEGLLLDIAGGSPFRTTVREEPAGWAAHVTADAALPRFPEGADVSIGPHNRPIETHGLRSAEPVDVRFPPRELADLTPFLRLTVRQTVKGEALERSTIICSRLEGAPSERFDQILARQIDTPEKFLRLLALLIGFAARGGDAAAVAGDGSGSWAAGAGQGVLELLARALSENPESIDHLETIVEQLRRSPSGRAVLPEGWDEVWEPALEARRALLAGSS